MPDVGSQVVRIFAGETILRPIVFKCSNSLKAKPFKLMTRMPTNAFRGCICIAIIARQVNTILEDGLTCSKDPTKHSGL